MYSEALLDAVARARHDLGKYIAFQVRSLDPGSSDDDVRSALDADLNHTRSTPDATCAQVWAGLRSVLLDAGLNPGEVHGVDEVISTLSDRAARLEHLDSVALGSTVALSLALGDRLRALHRRLLSEQPA